jgi:hypothetical protein
LTKKESYIKYLYWLDGEDEYENTPLAEPVEVFVDLPYESTGLRFLSQFDSSPFMISDIYKKLQNWSAFIDLLKDLGAKTKIEIEWANINSNVACSRLLQAKGKRFTDSGIHQDWKIKGLDKILENKDNRHEISKLLWDLLSTTDIKHFSAVYRMNSEYPAVYADSQLTYKLKIFEWIPDKSGDFYKPADISKEMLHPDFVDEKSNGWLERIGFGDAVTEKLEEENARRRVLEDMGISAENAALLKDQSPEMIAEVINELKNKKLQQSLEESEGSGKTKKVVPYDGPQSLVDNPEGLQNKIAKDIDNPSSENPPNTNSKTTSSKDYKNINEIRTFLYGQYNGHCQICGDTFVDNQDKNFFELYSLNRSKRGDRLKSDINRPGNSLSLCPKHHKILKLGLQKFTFLDMIQSSELTQDSIASLFEIRDYATNEEDEFYNVPEGSGFYLDDALMLPIEIFKETRFIKFSLEHMINFIEVWNKK